jgi:sarcosine oxidase, subunit gamma
MRASFVRAPLAALSAFPAQETGGGLVATRVPGENPAAPVVLCDLSPLPRTGFKGADTARWLAAQGLVFPDTHNWASAQADGSLAARLSPGEFLLLGRLDGAPCAVERLQAGWSWEAEAGMCFPVPRQDSHAWFYFGGPKSAEAMAKLCGVDVRPHRFPAGSIAQTSVARLNAIVIARAGGFYLLADSASAEYFWACLTDAMAEFAGSVVGTACLGLA